MGGGLVDKGERGKKKEAGERSAKNRVADE
jgi:hypothetical protein